MPTSSPALTPREQLDAPEAGRVALKFFFNLMERWGCSAEQQRTLLGGVGGPLSYVGGAALSGDALTFPKEQISVLVLVAVWALLALMLGQSRRFYAKAM